MTTEIQTYQPQQMQVQPQSLFFNISAFMDGQRMASLLASSKLIPANFQGNMPDCLIALELAVRIGVSPMAVMQNMFIIHGRPGYSAQFIIAMVNSCGKFSPLRFDLEGAGDDRSCTAWAFELATGDKLSGTTVSIKMAKAEGWMGKSGSKWQTMPELMLRYRSAAFFGRLYAPELLMGMRTAEELYDEPGKEIPAAVSKTDLNARFATGTANVSTKKQEVIEAEVAEVPEPVGPPPAEVAAPKQSTKRSSQSKATPPPQEPVKPEPVTTLPPVAATADPVVIVGHRLRRHVSTTSSVITSTWACFLITCNLSLTRFTMTSRCRKECGGDGPG